MQWMEVRNIKKEVDFLDYIKHKKKFIYIFIMLLLAVYVFIGFAQQSLILTVYNIASSAVPKGLDGYRIIQISDFHSGLFNATTADVIKLIDEQTPDSIVLTGDIIDSEMRDFSAVEELIAGLTGVAPVYAVSGNNEKYKSSINATIESLYKKYGVQNLDNRTITIYGSGIITLTGIADRGRARIDELDKEVLALKYGSDISGFGILLYHRANELDRLAELKYDLILSGHLHGGILRLPFIGGVLSPDGEFCPRYSGGIYESNGALLVSNRGIGNTYPIARFYNPPEVVMLVLNATQ